MTRADETIPAAWTDVLAERRRQVAEEWWTPQHDDKHAGGEMASAAACYVLPEWERDAQIQTAGMGWKSLRFRLWPWSDYWWKPTNRRRDLVKAGALILAEIERLDRASALIAREEDHGR